MWVQNSWKYSLDLCDINSRVTTNIWQHKSIKWLRYSSNTVHADITMQHLFQPQGTSYFKKCLLSFGAESFVYQFGIQRYKDKGTQNFHFVCCFVWVWNLTFQSGAEDHRLRVIENGGLGRIFGPRKEDVKWNWKRLRNEGLYDLHCSPNINRMIKSRKIRLNRHAVRMAERGR